MYKENNYCRSFDSSFNQVLEAIEHECFDIEPLKQEIRDLVKEFVEANKSLVKESVYVHR